MARRKKTSPVEDWMDLVAMLPWWAGVALALISFVILHALAAPAPVTAFKLRDMNALVVGSLVKGLAGVGQFVVLIICLFGALGSFLRRQHGQSLVTNVVQSKAADSLDNVSWREFELLGGEPFRLQGYRVTEIGGAGADGGVDLVLNKGNEKFFVQCKQWKAYKVSVTVVREIYGVMAAKGAASGFVVTSGRFTDDAVEFAAGRNIKLVDGALLFGMIKQARNARGAASEPFGSANASAPMREATLACPACGSAMKKRVAKRGANAGNEFWGCTTYPACKGTRDIDQI